MTIDSSVQYFGQEGFTSGCLDALRRLVQFGDEITAARLVTCTHTHAFLLRIGEIDQTVIRAGFSSGYRGEGPTGLKAALRLLESRRLHVEEIEVDEACLKRLNQALLTTDDLDMIREGSPVRPWRISDYTFSHYDPELVLGDVYREFPLTIPYRIIDTRILDLALQFHEKPDWVLLTAFRRLEATVRKRSGIQEVGSKLFSQAFAGKSAPLRWPDCEHESESTGRFTMFTGAYMAYRNPRAHSDLSDKDDLEGMLSELLVINHLFHLEAAAVTAPSPSTSSLAPNP